MALLNKLVFPLPEAIYSKYTGDYINQGLFDESGNLIVWCPREAYTPTDNSESGVVIGWQRSIVNFTRANYQFEATSPDNRIALYYALKDLETASNSVAIQTGSYPLITCYDYHNDWDYVSQQQSVGGYATRLGVLKISLTSGTYAHTDTGSLWTNGVKLFFQEVVLR
jgi:hypothetical protein